MNVGVEERRAAELDPVMIGEVALTVRDLDRVSRFYEEAIGLEVVQRTADGVRLGAGGIAFLELQHRPDALPRDPAAAGLYHTAFLLPERADLGRWLAHAAELRSGLDGAADHLVSEAVYLHDPEGNGIEVYVDRPRASWQWSGGRVEMANARLDMIGLRALATTKWTGAPTGTRVGHVHLQVGEIKAAEAFYAGVLGFEIVRERPDAVFLSTGRYHHHLACNIWESAGAGPRDPRRAGLAWVTLDAADLDGMKARAGASISASEEIRDPWGTVIRVRQS
jgi:catechol 2,3-dioxygenase